MSDKITDEFIDEVIKLGGLLLDFAQVERMTYVSPAGIKESDTDHTTMLAIIACAIAAKLEPQLDLGKIAQYALVHDLVEVYAGDVNTIDFHATNHEQKQINESKALKKIEQEFGEVFPWIHTTISAYEELADPEARFVKSLDKIMPAITHEFTDNRVVNENFDTPEAFERSVFARNEHMKKTFARDQANIMELREKLLARTVRRKYRHHGR